MKTDIDQCRHQLELAARVVVRLDDSHRALEPQPGAKTAGWLLGHLAVTGDFGCRLCGGPAICPPEWRAAFNPGSSPSLDAAAYPPMPVLRGTFLEVYDNLCWFAARADASRLGAANPYEPARHAFPTVGDFVAYLLCSHLSYHLGQLAGWCAAAGMGGVAAQPRL